MGLFSKSPEEKKLKQLTGGFFLADSFKDTLKSFGIELDIGFHIQNTLKEEIKMGRLSVDEIEPRLNFLVKQFATINYEEEPIINRVEVSSPKQRTLKFLINQNHNLVTCPKCNARILKSDTYCYSCGFNFTNYSSKNNDSDSNFKFAYVLYLDYYKKFGDIIPKKLIEDFNVSITSLTKQSIDDNYITNQNLNDLTVKELKDILRSNNLKLSGRKNELIERINSNLDLSSSLSKSGEDFINKNRHVFYFFNNPELKSIISVGEFDALFLNVDNATKSIVKTKLIEFIEDKESSYKANYDVDNYKNLQFFLTGFFEKNNEINFSFERYLRLFIMDLNNFSKTFKKAEPQYCSINQVLTDKIIFMVNSYSIDDVNLKVLFENAFLSVSSFKPLIGRDDSLDYLKNIIDGMDTIVVENQIRSKGY